MDDKSINTNDLPPESMTEEQFSIFVNFDNDLEESCEILHQPQFHQSEIDKNELMKNVLSKISRHILKLIMLVMLSDVSQKRN